MASSKADYLKKYTSAPDASQKKKRKKPKPGVMAPTCRLVDDDVRAKQKTPPPISDDEGAS